MEEVIFKRSIVQRKNRRKTLLGDADEDILVALATYRCLTRAQLMRLLGKTGRPEFSTRLKWLADHGYIVREQAREGFGAPLLCFLTEKAKKYLATIDVSAKVVSPENIAFTPESTSTPHLLATNDVLIAVLQWMRTDPAWSLHILRHEQQFRQKPLRLDGIRVIPDGWVELRYHAADGIDRFVFAIEVQHRGHTDIDDIREKVRNYIAIAKAGVHKAYFDDPKLPMVVLFLGTKGAAKVAAIKDAFEAELKEKRNWADMFYVAPFTREIVEEHMVYELPVWERAFSSERRALLDWV